MVQSKLKRWGEASTSIQRARELAPDNIGYQIHQAAIFVGAGDRAKAQSAFEKVSDLRPEDRKLNETDRERLRLLKKEFASI